MDSFRGFILWLCGSSLHTAGVCVCRTDPQAYVTEVFEEWEAIRKVWKMWQSRLTPLLQPPTLRTAASLPRRTCPKHLAPMLRSPPGTGVGRKTGLSSVSVSSGIASAWLHRSTRQIGTCPCLVVGAFSWPIDLSCHGSFEVRKL